MCGRRPSRFSGGTRTVPATIRLMRLASSQGWASAALVSKTSMSPACCRVSPMASRPFSIFSLRPRIDLEGEALARRRGHGLGLQVDGEHVVAALGLLHQRLHLLGRQDHGQQAVLEAVVVEDVGEAGGDHAADAEVQQRPGRVLAARAAAEVVAGDQHAGALVGRLVEHEVRASRWPSPSKRRS